MRPMRSLLLWMARDQRLRETLPRMPFARRAVRRFMPGERLEDAFAAADRLQDEGLGVLFTHLGENVTSLAEAMAVAEHYATVMQQDHARAHPLGRVEISIKPSQLGLDQDPEACFAHCDELARRCAASDTWFWLDMEGSHYTEATVRLYERLAAEHEKVGIALQAYLRRTAADVERLLPRRPAIRLVKGAYNEPEAVAYRSKTAVDGNFQALAVIVAQAAGRGAARLALGTHDTDLIERISTIAEAGGVQRSALEVHMLYGIRVAELRRLRDAGYPAFSLVAYGDAWYAWYMRRLAERPANLVFALRQLLP
ncbi:proline dehydrogenase family protein [soil metagenome]